MKVYRLYGHKMKYSVLKFSDLDFTSLRIDAEYYQTSYLDTERKIKKSSWNFLKNLTNSIKSFGAYSLCNQVAYKASGVPFLRCKDIKEGIIDLSEVLYIDNDANKLLWKSEVKPRTVLFTMSGTVGNSAIASEYISYPINSNQDIAKIETNNEKLNPYFLYVFFQSSYGRNQISRLPIGSVQQHIFLWQIESFLIPTFDILFQSSIEDIVLTCEKLTKKSSSLFETAKNILLSELGLTNWKLKHQLSFVRNLSEVEDAERLDAEYLQPKYDEVIELFLKKNGTPLQKIASLTKGNQARCETGTIPYASIKDIHDNVIESEEFAEGSNQLVLVGKDDLALAITGATTGKIGVNIKNEKIAICGDLLRIHAKDISPYYLLAFLGIPIVTDLFKRSITGMTNGHLSPEIVKEIPVPILEKNVIEQIDNGIKKAFSLMEQSKHLLECAKRAVEIAIEQDEQTAIEWLEKETA